MAIVTLFRVAVERRKISAAQTYLTPLEHLAPLMGDGCPEAGLKAISDFLHASANDADRVRRTRIVHRFALTLTSASRWLKELQQTYPTVSRPIATDWLRPIVNETKAVIAISSDEQKKRDEVLLGRLMGEREISAIVSARVDLVTRLGKAFRDKVELLTQSGGLEADIPLEIVPGYPDEIATFKVVRLDKAWEIAIGRSSKPLVNIAQYQQLLRKAQDQAAGGSLKFVCLYEGSHTGVHDQAAYFVDLYRFALLDPGHRLSQASRRLADRRCDELQFKRPGNRLGGILNADPMDRSLIGALRDDDPTTSPVLIPVPELEVATLLAAAALGISRDAGPRVRELQQIAVNCGNIGTHFVGRLETPYFECIPKNGDRPIKKDISHQSLKEIVAAVESLHRLHHPTLVNMRGLPTIGAVGFCGRDPASFARRPYLFQNGRRGLDSSEMNLLLNVLLVGVATTHVHGERRLGATRVGLRLSDRRILERFLHHKRMSHATPIYDRSAAMISGGLADDFAERDRYR